jgi:hypothetical protein
MRQDLRVGVFQRIAGLLYQPFDRGGRDLKTAQVLDQPGALAPRDPGGGQRRGGRRDRRPERARRHPGGQRRQRAVPTPAAHPVALVLGDLHGHDQLADLMTDRIAISDPPVGPDRRLAGAAGRRPVLDDHIGIGDHRAVAARMTGLAALTASRPGLLGALGTRGRRVTRGRQRAVARISADLPLELLDPGHQREHQIDDRLRVTLDRRPQILSPHIARFPAPSRNPAPSPDDPLNAYAQVSPGRPNRQRTPPTRWPLQPGWPSCTR